MKLWMTIAATVLLFCAAPPLHAQPKVHPFEAPPTLMETPPAVVTAVPALQAVTPQPCRPQGAVSRNGPIVTAELDFVRAHFTINNPDPTDPQPNGEDPVELRSYGGCKSGPVLEVRPGDTVRINLVNRSSKDDPTCWDVPPPGLNQPKGVGCFNTTNLHLHGLHVSPAGNSDNVLLDIAPQTRFPYEINIPADHPAGTFWYHAHRHGSTAAQVASGASGILVVRGVQPYRAPTPQDPKPQADIDTILHDASGAPFHEKLFLFQQIAYACFAEQANVADRYQSIFTTAGPYTNSTNPNQPNSPANAPWTCPLSTPDQKVTPGVVENFNLQLDSPTIWDTNGRFTSINGVVQPTLEVPAGEIQRWRFVHAGIHDTINVQVVEAAQPGSGNLIAASALSGNRQAQTANVISLCQATKESLIPQFEIASDGLTRRQVRMIHDSTTSGVLESNYLQPGYRSDILVVFPHDGDYCLLDQAAPPAERVSNGTGGGQGPSTPQLLAYVHVRGGQPVTTDLRTYVEQALYSANPQLPGGVRDGLKTGNLLPWAPFDELPAQDVVSQQHANFQITANSKGVFFTINGASYDPSVVNVTREVNTTDDWLLTAEGEPHIFHIHVNPFEVVDVTTADQNGQQVSIFDEQGHCKPSVSSDSQQLASQYCGMYHVFKDTVFVENAYQVHIRTRYDRYIGEYVIHCHILDHEDAGMMMNVAIVPDLNSPTGGIGMAGMRH